MKEAPIEEQNICVDCGFCCDRTLFDVARVYDDEELWGVFAERETMVNEQRYFKLPCPHFDKKCTIYDQNKPRICSTFRCKILKRFSDNEISKDDALTTVEEVKKQRQELLDLWKKYTGKEDSFRSIYYRCVRDEDKDAVPPEIVFRANLLEIQLTKHFKSKEMFDKFYELME